MCVRSSSDSVSSNSSCSVESRVGSVLVGSGDEARRVAKELQLANSSEQRTLYFHGESMRPFLAEGDEVVVVPVALADLRRGDVVTYRLGEKFPTRRLLRRLPDRLVMWCENWPDRYFDTQPGDILGRAVARKRDGRWISHRDREWKVARRSALFKYWRLVAAPRAYWRLRTLAGRLLRRLGLRKPLPVRDA